MSTHRFIALVFLSTALQAQMRSTRAGWPFMDEFSRVDPDNGPLVVERSEIGPPMLIASTISVRELQHPVPERALRAAYEGQRYALANNARKAILKLEQAVRLDPLFRDAHCDLGVLYARARRFAEAQSEFQKALEAGPPVAPIYSNLALTFAESGDLQRAETLARKALQLDAHNAVAQALLRYARPH